MSSWRIFIEFLTLAYGGSYAYHNIFSSEMNSMLTDKFRLIMYSESANFAKCIFKFLVPGKPFTQTLILINNSLRNV